jgi:hypothetical protein
MNATNTHDERKGGNKFKTETKKKEKRKKKKKKDSDAPRRIFKCSVLSLRFLTSAKNTRARYWLGTCAKLSYNSKLAANASTASRLSDRTFPEVELCP